MVMPSRVSRGDRAKLVHLKHALRAVRVGDPKESGDAGGGHGGPRIIDHRLGRPIRITREGDIRPGPETRARG